MSHPFHPFKVAEPNKDGSFLPQSKRFHPGATIIGPCGFGCTVVQDNGGPYLLIEEYTGDQSVIRRDKLPNQQQNPAHTAA